MPSLNELFQSPRSEKFVSDRYTTLRLNLLSSLFQSPRSGKFVSDMLTIWSMATS